MFDFEAQVFNIYNHKNLGMPSKSGVVTKAVSTPVPRTIQLQAKFVFEICCLQYVRRPAKFAGRFFCALEGGPFRKPEKCAADNGPLRG